MVLPVADFLADPERRREVGGDTIIAYGPPRWFRSAWLAGARDYLKDPWTPEELFLRLRGPSPGTVTWACQNQTLTLEGRVLSAVAGATIRLSSGEAAILQMLVLRRGTAISRAILAWAAGCTAGRVVDTLVARIRMRLSSLGVSESVVAVRGVGYRLP